MTHQINQQQFSRVLAGGGGGSTAVWGDGVIDSAEEWGIHFSTFLLQRI